MNRLIEIGFERAGHWYLTEGGIAVELVRLATQRNILYAFCCDGEVKYIGKTVSPLASRMSGYKNPASSQATNVRNNARIADVLKSGGAVDILALPDNGLMHYGQFHLNLAAGLEDDLIRVIRPEWNGGRKEAVPELREEGSEDQAPSPVEAALNGVKGSFVVTLHPTYYRTGFFNVLRPHEGMFGSDGETIEIYLPNAGRPILGKINRTANQNSTPRVMGGTGLKDWFQAAAQVMGAIRVDVLSPTAIRVGIAVEGK